MRTWLRQHSEQLVGIGLVNLATLTWATNITFGRFLRNDVGPLTLAAIRFIIGSIFFAILLSRRAERERRVGKDGWLLIAMGLLSVTFFAPALYLALQYTTALNTTLIFGLGPLITGLLASLMIDEPMSRRQMMGAVSGLLGVAVLVSGDSLTSPGGGGLNKGDLLAIAATILWALYSVLARRATRNRSALSATAFSSYFGLPGLIIAATWELQATPIHFFPALIPIVLYLGLVPTVVGFSSWNEGVRRLGASGAMVFYNTLPLYGALLGCLFLGETLGFCHVIGGGLIIGGALWASRTR